MSLDFPPSSQHPLYPQNDLDHQYSSLSNGSDMSSTPSHQHQSSHHGMNSHVLDRPDPMDVSDHNSYDIFSGQSNQRFRSGTSSSMSSSYGLGVDSMYTQSPFSDSLPHFHNPSPDPYNLMGGLPSSYSSGKPSPLTPNDSVGSLQQSSAFPFNNGQPKDFHSNHGFTDVLDRRMSNLSTGSYPSDYDEGYNGINVNSGLGLGFNSSTLPPFQDRSLGRMQQDSRYPPSVIPPLSLPHLHQNHGQDMLRGVNPHAMHGSPYGEIPSFLAPNPHDDFSLRMPDLGDPMSRVRLNGAGAATDLQTFIRYVLTVI